MVPGLTLLPDITKYNKHSPGARNHMLTSAITIHIHHMSAPRIQIKISVHKVHNITCTACHLQAMLLKIHH